MAVTRIAQQDHVGWRRWAAIVVGFIGTLIIAAVLTGKDDWRRVGRLPDLGRGSRSLGFTGCGNNHHFRPVCRIQGSQFEKPAAELASVLANIPGDQTCDLRG